MIGSLLIGEIEQKTNIKFKNVVDFETYINAILVDNDKRMLFLPGVCIN